MYGMVTNALQEMVVARLGEDAWPAICKEANVKENYFLSLECYSDEITYNLFGAAAKTLGMPLDDFLQEFGLYWIEYALKTAYGPLLKNAGNTLFETLESLDNLHGRIGMALPDLKPPSFRIIKETDSTTIIYKSSRLGLSPFVIGLLHGLAAMHGVKIKVLHTKAKSETLDHDEFKIWIEE